jgi:hypothetical protein
MPGRLAGSIPIIATLVLAALGVEAPTARAEDCLASPNSPAPKGSWWYYRLDWPTQRKCWYLRSFGWQAKQTAERETNQRPGSGSARSEPTRPSDSTDDSTPSLLAADTATVGSIVREAIAPQASSGSPTNAPIAPPTQNDASAISATIQQSAHEGKAAEAFPGRPGQETSASSQADAQTAGANDAGVASPDAVPRIVAHAVSTDASDASVPDDYIERVVRSRKQAANEQPPIFFFVIAVGLAVIGIAIHFVRRLRFRV